MGDITLFICGDKTCDHDSDGPWQEWTDEETGCTTGTATCSKCGQTALERSLWDGA